MAAKRSKTRPTDNSGYAARDADLRFLGLSVSDLTDLMKRRRPLGMTLEEYDYLLTEVHHALYREGIEDADVRLQGSSAHFFSSAHKRMPYSLEDIANIWRQVRSGVPEGYRCRSILEDIENQWPAWARPTCRPFDSMFAVGLSETRSDYDVQISSDQMVQIVRDELRRRRLDPEKVTTTDTHYAYILKEYSDTFFPHIGMACGRVSERVQRSVAWVLFESNGPSRNWEAPCESSHFKNGDWILNRVQAETLQ